MKKYLLVTLLLTTQGLRAQLPLRPLPQPGFAERLGTYVDTMVIVDTHEHLMDQKTVRDHMPLDFMLLLHHYADDDIKSAGMSKPQFASLMTDDYTVSEKWQIVRPYWEATRNTAYCRVVLLTLDRLFGIRDLNGETVHEISDTLRAVYETDWYDHVLRERSRIMYAIQDVGPRRMAGDLFVHVEKMDAFVRIFSGEDLRAVADPFQASLDDLDSYVTLLETAFQQAVNRGIVGIKSALAYHRTLHYADADRGEAEKIFGQLMGMPDSRYTLEEVKPLQDFMMHQIIRLAREHDLPMQYHTGLQSGDGNIISNADPSHLANLFLQYRDVNFVLFHGGYPYGGVVATMAKNFRNVYVDMCWDFIISPSYSERYLHEWLETVPSNKIFAFGGDYHNVENTFGHALMARAIVAKVLIEKVRTAYLTEAEAIDVARRILRDNAIELYGLQLE